MFSLCGKDRESNLKDVILRGIGLRSPRSGIGGGGRVGMTIIIIKK